MRSQRIKYNNRVIVVCATIALLLYYLRLHARKTTNIAFMITVFFNVEKNSQESETGGTTFSK